MIKYVKAYYVVHKSPLNFAILTWVLTFLSWTLSINLYTLKTELLVISCILTIFSFSFLVNLIYDIIFIYLEVPDTIKQINSGLIFLGYANPNDAVIGTYDIKLLNKLRENKKISNKVKLYR